MNGSQQPLVSIITVVYNDVKNIERTLSSVINQTYPYIEYIVVDGASTDGTRELILNYKEKIDTFFSEKDYGIYDAMNKGLLMAKGDYVLFLNSGDELYNESTLEKIFSLPFTHADIYYGETEMYNQEWKSLGRRRHKVPRQLTWKSFRYGMCVCHQAIYVRREIAELYDLKYQLSADIDWVLKALKKAKQVVNAQQYVVKYLVGGISKKKHFKSLKERFFIFSNHFGFWETLANHGIIALRLVYSILKHWRVRE